MNLTDAVSVAESLHTSDGLFWPVPIVNLVESADGISVGQRIALKDPNVDGQPVLAVMQIEAIETVSDQQMDAIVEQVFGTLDSEHPGVAAFTSQGGSYYPVPLTCLAILIFKMIFLIPIEQRLKFALKWNLLAGKKRWLFKLENPMHRAHEELCRMALEDLGADGCLVHMLLGKLKPGDIPAEFEMPQSVKWSNCTFHLIL